jgi:hypothetical protein
MQVAFGNLLRQHLVFTQKSGLSNPSPALSADGDPKIVRERGQYWVAAWLPCPWLLSHAPLGRKPALLRAVPWRSSQQDGTIQPPNRGEEVNLRVCAGPGQIDNTAEPLIFPSRKRLKASLALLRGNSWTSVRIGIFGASARNSSASRLVRLATDLNDRSSQRIE